MQDIIEQAIKILAERSAREGVKSDDAMRLSQAAQNLAHTLQTFNHAKTMS